MIENNNKNKIIANATTDPLFWANRDIAYLKRPTCFVSNWVCKLGLAPTNGYFG